MLLATFVTADKSSSRRGAKLSPSETNTTLAPLPLTAPEDTYLPAESENPAELSFPAVCLVNVTLENGRTIPLIDCASEGRTWGEDSDFKVWMQTNPIVNKENTDV